MQTIGTSQWQRKQEPDCPTTRFVHYLDYLDYLAPHMTPLTSELKRRGSGYKEKVGKEANHASAGCAGSNSIKFND